jgi:hypothetical protein
VSVSIADQLAALGGDCLVPFGEAATRFGCTTETLKRWHRQGLLPAIKFGGRWCTFASFVLSVFLSPRPKLAGDLEQLAKEWFAAHNPGHLLAAA